MKFLKSQIYCFPGWLQYLNLLIHYFSAKAILAEFHDDLFFPTMGFTDQEYSCLESALWKVCGLIASFNLACGDTHFDYSEENGFGRASMRLLSSSLNLSTLHWRCFEFCALPIPVFLAANRAQYVLTSKLIFCLNLFASECLVIHRFCPWLSRTNRCFHGLKFEEFFVGTQMLVP